MVERRRVWLFVVVALACTLGAAAAIVTAARNDTGGPAGSAQAAQRALREARRPMILFRSLDHGTRGAFGQVAVAAADSSATARVLAPLRCERVYFAAGRGLCLARSSGFARGYRALVLGSDLRVRHALDVDGVPSRARVSPDGRYGSVTLFVSGHAYSDPGSFSTETTLLDLARGTKIGRLEEFTTSRGGRQLTAVDMNFWGVTFARDSDRFYATLATGGKTYLVEGSVRARTMRTIHENVECPSLSPDGTRIAFKKRVKPGPWRVTVLDLATGRETALSERRSVDDQVEWLDDDRLLYGLERKIWVVRADGQGKPLALATNAESPAVVGRRKSAAASVVRSA